MCKIMLEANSDDAAMAARTNVDVEITVTTVGAPTSIAKPTVTSAPKRITIAGA
jgi:hypothetical protein